MDQWLLAVTSDPAAKGSAKDLEVAGAGPVHCRFSIPPSFLTMCSSERCLSLASPWYIDHLSLLKTVPIMVCCVLHGCSEHHTVNGSAHCGNQFTPILGVIIPPYF